MVSSSLNFDGSIFIWWKSWYVGSRMYNCITDAWKAIVYIFKLNCSSFCNFQTLGNTKVKELSRTIENEGFQWEISQIYWLGHFNILNAKGDKVISWEASDNKSSKAYECSIGIRSWIFSGNGWYLMRIFVIVWIILIIMVSLPFILILMTCAYSYEILYALNCGSETTIHAPLVTYTSVNDINKQGWDVWGFEI